MLFDNDRISFEITEKPAEHQLPFERPSPKKLVSAKLPTDAFNTSDMEFIMFHCIISAICGYYMTLPSREEIFTIPLYYSELQERLIDSFTAYKPLLADGNTRIQAWSITNCVTTIYKRYMVYNEVIAPFSSADIDRLWS